MHYIRKHGPNEPVPFYAALHSINSQSPYRRVVSFSERILSFGQTYIYEEPQTEKRKAYLEAIAYHFVSSEAGRCGLERRVCCLSSSLPKDLPYMSESTLLKVGIVALQGIAASALLFPRVRVIAGAFWLSMIAIKVLHRNMRFFVKSGAFEAGFDQKEIQNRVIKLPIESPEAEKNLLRSLANATPSSLEEEEVTSLESTTNEIFQPETVRPKTTPSDSEKVPFDAPEVPTRLTLNRDGSAFRLQSSDSEAQSLRDCEGEDPSCKAPEMHSGNLVDSNAEDERSIQSDSSEDLLESSSEFGEQELPIQEAPIPVVRRIQSSCDSSSSGLGNNGVWRDVLSDNEADESHALSDWHQAELAGHKVKTFRFPLPSPKERVQELEDNDYLAIDDDGLEITTNGVKVEQPIGELFSSGKYRDKDSQVEVSFLVRGRYLVVHAMCSHFLAEGSQKTVLLNQKISWIPTSALDCSVVRCLTEEVETAEDARFQRLVGRHISASRAVEENLDEKERVIVLNAGFVPSPDGTSREYADHRLSQIAMIAEQILIGLATTRSFSVQKGEMKLISTNSAGDRFFPDHIAPSCSNFAKIFRKNAPLRIVTPVVRPWKCSELEASSVWNFFVEATNVQNPQVWKETKYLYSLCNIAKRIPWENESYFSCKAGRELLRACGKFLEISFNREMTQEEKREMIFKDPHWIEKISPGMVFLNAQRNPEESPRKIYEDVIFTTLRENLREGIRQCSSSEKGIKANSSAQLIAFTMSQVPLIDYAKSLRSLLTADAPFTPVTSESWHLALQQLKEAVSNSKEYGKSKLTTNVKKFTTKCGAGNLIQKFGNLPFLLGELTIDKGGRFKTQHIRLANPDIRAHGMVRSDVAPEFEALLDYCDTRNENMVYFDHLDCRVADELPRSRLVRRLAEGYDQLFAFQQPLDGWVQEAGLVHQELKLPELPYEDNLDVPQYLLALRVEKGYLQFEGGVQPRDVLGKVRSSLLQHLYADTIGQVIEETEAIERKLLSLARGDKTSTEIQLNRYFHSLKGLLLSLKVPNNLEHVQVELEDFSPAQYGDLRDKITLIKDYLYNLQLKANTLPFAMERFVTQDSLWGRLESFVVEVISPAFDQNPALTAKCQVALLHALMGLLCIGEMEIKRFNNTCKDGIDRGAVIMVILQYLSAMLSENQEYRNTQHLENLIDLFIAPAYMAKSQAVLHDRLEVAQQTLSCLTSAAHNEGKRQRLKELFDDLSAGMKILQVEIPTALPDRDLWPHLDLSLGDIMRMDPQLQADEEKKNLDFAKLFTTQLQWLISQKDKKEDLGAICFRLEEGPSGFNEGVVKDYCQSLEGTAPLFNWVSRTFGFVDPAILNTQAAIISNVECVVTSDEQGINVTRSCRLPLLVPHMRRIGYFEHYQREVSEEKHHSALEDFVERQEGPDSLKEARAEYFLQIEIHQSFTLKELEVEGEISYFAGSPQQVANWKIEEVNS